MGGSKALRISVLVLLGAAVAEGYFLSSLEHGQASKQPVLEVAYRHGQKKPSERDGNTTHDDEPEVKEVPPIHKVKEMERQMDPTHKGRSYKKQVHDQQVPKYPIIAFFNNQLKRVFGKYSEHWYMDWKLWVGVTFWAAVWAKWLIYGYDEIYLVRAISAFGINIWILHELQYGSTIKMGMVVVCIVLTIQTLFSTWVWYHSETVEDELSDFDCDTLYLDLKLPGEQIGVLFIAQFGVWWFYMTSILGNFDFDNVNYLFWFWAFLVMQMTMIFNRGADSVLGNAFPVHDVDRMMRNASKVEFVPVDDDGEPIEGGLHFQRSRFEILWRGLLGFFCNSILREIMSYTIPLMLMGFSEPMDFVVYCVGVNFICTLDDMSELKYGMKPLKDEADNPEADEATTAKTS